MDDNASNREEGYLLYVRSVCMTCLGKSYSCPYCEGEGKNYIQASDKTVARWINNLNKDRKEDIMKLVKKGIEDD
jgi:hypothetical protein